MEESVKKSPATRRKIKLAVRLLISGGLLYLIFSNIQLEALWNVLTLISIETFFLVAFLYLVSQLMSAIKWRVLVNGVGIHRPLKEFFRAYIFGMFVNVFGLGTVGGDVARAVALRPQRGERAAAFATVLADRIHGLGVLLAIGCTAIALLKPGHFPDFVIYGSYLFLAAIALFWWVGPKLLLRYFQEGHRLNSAAIQAATAFPSSMEPFLTTTLLSVVFHSLQIFTFYVITQELETNIPLSYLFAVIPVVNTLATLPISIQGIGVRESTLILLLAPLGVSEEPCIAMGAIWLLATTLVSALGGLILVPDLIRTSDKLTERRAEDGEIIDIEEARRARGG